MSEAVSFTAPLTCWQGDRGTYHVILIDGASAKHITTHAHLHRMEYGKARGFGSVKVVAQIGDTRWKSSVFPQSATGTGGSGSDGSGSDGSGSDGSGSDGSGPDGSGTDTSGPNGKAPKEWFLLVSKKVMRAEDLAEGDPIPTRLELL